MGVTLGSREVQRGAAVIVPAHHHTLPHPPVRAAPPGGHVGALAVESPQRRHVSRGGGVEQRGHRLGL